MRTKPSTPCSSVSRKRYGKLSAAAARPTRTLTWRDFGRFETNAGRRCPFSRICNGGSAAPAGPARSSALRDIQIRQRAFEGFRRKTHGLRKCRMRMNGQTDIRGVHTHLDAEHQLRDQLAGVRPDDARAEKLVRLR